VRPTDVYRKLMSEEATPFLSFAADLMRRFMREYARIGEYGNRSFKRLLVVAEARYPLPRLCY
jgi:hypothetical protein